jgi:putative ABC transport system permease protein
MGLIREIQFALRRWRNRPLVALTASLTLALGIGATTSVFSIVDAVMLRPLPYPQADRLVNVWGRFPEWRANPASTETSDRVALSWPEFVELRAGTATLDELALDGGHQAVITEGSPEEVKGRIVTASFFSLLGAAPILGRTLEPHEDTSAAHVVVLAHDLWRRRYGGDRSVVGRTIRLDDRPFVVVGVVGPTFRYGDRSQYWIPVGAVPDRLTRGDHGFRVTARLRSGVTIDDVQREADRILRGGEPALLGGASVARPFDRDARPAQPLLLLLAGSAATLLLIACANVAGLLFGEAVWRRREMTVRSALGASRWRILRQLLVESAALALIGTSIGILLAYLLTPLLVARAPAGVPNLEDVGVDIRVLTFACLLMAATTIASGCGPGLALARRIQGGQVREGGRTSTASRRTQSALVIGEIALTMALLFAAGLLITTLSRLNEVNPGFAPHNLLTVRLRPPASRYEDPARRRAFDAAMLERLSGLPGVLSAAWVGPLAFSGSSATNVIQLERYEPLPGEPKPEAQTRAVSPAYFATMGIPVISGRAFAESDGDAAPRVAIVSSLFEQRYSPAASPLGMRFRWQGAWWTVVGVVGDTKHQGLDAAELRTFYVPAAQKPGRANQLVLKVTTSPGGIASAATEAIRQVDPDVLIQEVAAMEQLIDLTLFDERYRATLASAFALFAGLIAGVGLYGTLARSVSDRRREIGIRMALGARPSAVLRLIAGQGGRLVVAGMVLGLLAAFAAGRAVSTLTFGVRSFEPWILCATVGMLGLVAAAAIAGPARRAARVDPMVALRE